MFFFSRDRHLSLMRLAMIFDRCQPVTSVARGLYRTYSAAAAWYRDMSSATGFMTQLRDYASCGFLLPRTITDRPTQAINPNARFPSLARFEVLWPRPTHAT